MKSNNSNTWSINSVDVREVGWLVGGGGVNTRDLHKGKELNYHCHSCRAFVSNIMQE